MLRRQDEACYAAVAEPEEHGPLEPQLDDQAVDVLGEVSVMVFVDVLAPAMPAGVHGDHPEEVPELLDGDVEDGHVLPVAVEHDKRAALAHGLVMDPRTVDISKHVDRHTVGHIRKGFRAGRSGPVKGQPFLAAASLGFLDCSTNHKGTYRRRMTAPMMTENVPFSIPPLMHQNARQGISMKNW